MSDAQGRATKGLSDVEFINLQAAARNAGRDWRNLMGYRDAPLSGEWGGESIPEIGERYDLDLFDSELADQFEIGFEGEA